MPSTAVVTVVGLFLLSSQIEPGRLIAVAPRIPNPAANTTLQAGTAEMAMRNSGVEEHVVTLQIPASKYVSSSGWTPAYTNSGKQTMYVKLDGHRVRFIPSPFPRRNNRPIAEQDNSIGVPHLVCCKTSTLWEGYLPPYQLAAAVVDFSSGRPEGCNARTGVRYSAVVDIENGGLLTIELTKPNTTTRIVVRGDAHISVENTPVTYVPWVVPYVISHVHRPDDDSGTPHGPNHQLAMMAMIKSCDPQPCDRNGGCVPPHINNAQCSNNQWP